MRSENKFLGTVRWVGKADGLVVGVRDGLAEGLEVEFTNSAILIKTKSKL
jgi:hypothetical protein